MPSRPSAASTPGGPGTTSVPPLPPRLAPAHLWRVAARLAAEHNLAAVAVPLLDVDLKDLAVRRQPLALALGAPAGRGGAEQCSSALSLTLCRAQSARNARTAPAGCLPWHCPPGRPLGAPPTPAPSPATAQRTQHPPVGGRAVVAAAAAGAAPLLDLLHHAGPQGPDLDLHTAAVAGLRQPTAMRQAANHSGQRSTTGRQGQRSGMIRQGHQNGMSRADALTKYSPAHCVRSILCAFCTHISVLLLQQLLQQPTARRPPPRTSQVYLRPLLLPLPAHLSHLMLRVICSLRTLPLYSSSRPTFILQGLGGGGGHGGGRFGPGAGASGRRRAAKASGVSCSERGLLRCAKAPAGPMHFAHQCYASSQTCQL